jgi:hypothetical protein
MACARCTNKAPVPPPAYHRAAAQALHLDALTLVTRLHLLEICRAAARLASSRVYHRRTAGLVMSTATCLPAAGTAPCPLPSGRPRSHRRPAPP